MEECTITFIDLNLSSKIAGIFLSLLIITVNLIEIHILRKTANKPFYENILLSLTLLDLIFGVFASTGVLSIYLLKTKYRITLYWDVWGFGMCYWTLVSILHLIIISTDTLWAVWAPLHHRLYVSKRKLVISITMSWCLPLIFVVPNIIVIFTKQMGAYKMYTYLQCTMFSDIAKIVVVTDILLFISYFAIIWTLYKNKTKANQNKSANQTKLMTTLIVCMSIVSVFVLFTTPYVAVYIKVWEKPKWLILLTLYLFPLSQVANSTIYLVQKYRSKRKESRDKKQANVELDKIT